MADEVVASATREIQKEASFPQWFAKVNERVTLTLLCMKDRVDKVQESDYDILRALHGIWFTGECPIYQTITIPDTRQSKQGELFHTDTVSETTAVVTENVDSFDDARDKILDGEVFATDIKETKKSKKNDNRKKDKKTE